MTFEQPVTPGCWAPRSYSKAVVIVIDALRYQFASYDESYEGVAEEKVPPYVNKMPVFRDLLRDKPDRALLFRFKVLPCHLLAAMFFLSLKDCLCACVVG